MQNLLFPLEVVAPSPLRDYQETTIYHIRQSILAGHKRVCLCSPTGSGKTKMFSFMVTEHLKKGGKALIITDRIELLKQAGKDFQNIQEIKSGHEPDLTRNLHVAMIETLHRRLDRYHNYLLSRTMIIIDEAHKQAFNKLFPHIADHTIVIGATATPYRNSNQDSMDEFYTDIVQIIDTPELIERGYLARAYSYGVEMDLKGIKKKRGDFDTSQMAKRYSENKIYEGVIENYNRICPGTKAILFASNVESSKEMAMKFNLAGIEARHLDSDMLDSERREILRWFNNTKTGILCNIGILTTGFDCPDIQTVILYRATTSLPLFLQMVGRGSRTIQGIKDKFTILDFGNNIKMHNFWEAPRKWSLKKKPKREKVDVAPVKICPQCNAMLAISVSQCSFCGFAYKREASGKNEIAELQLLSPEKLWKIAQSKDIEGKAEMVKAKLVKSFQVLHSLKTKAEGLAYCKAMGYKEDFFYHNIDRFKCFQQDK